MKNVKTFEDFINEALKPKNPNAVITIDVDLAGDDKDIMDAIKKFKLTAEPNGANNGTGYDLTGKRKDLIAYLTSEYYEMEDEDVEDIWPELLEGILESETGIFVMDNMRRHLHVAPEDVKDYIKGKTVYATDEDGEEYEINKKNTDVVSESSELDEAMVQVAGKSKPSGAKVLATVIVDNLESSNMLVGLKPSTKAAVIDAVTMIIMDNTF
jgi:hypothetical protein